MLKLAVLAACAAVALGATGATDNSGPYDAKCDEPRSWNIIRANEKGAKCGSVTYDPTEYRCCGKTLRRLASNTISVPSSQDDNIGLESDSQFCYGKDHVSSRQIVCGGEIVSSGTWDTYGRRLTVVACCDGTTYTKESNTYKDADGSTNTLSAKTIKACCAGTVSDLKADADTFAATLTCCGATTMDADPTKKTCCEGAVVDTDANKICCGTYITSDDKKTCCNNAYETKFDADGNLLGFCCNRDEGLSKESWALLDAVMTKATAPAKDSNDAVWTVNSVCNCKNEWLDVSKAWLEGQDQPMFTNQFLCPGGKDDKAPCALATTGLQAVTEQIGCCMGEPFLTANSNCIGLYKEADAIAREKGEDVGEVGPSYKSGKHLRVNFVDGNYEFEPVSEFFSPNFYNTKTDVVDVYCGKSSAATAVASVVAACLAFLAL
jgi:hypothetical protein